MDNNEELQFEQLLADKRHKELIGSLTAILSSLSQNKEADKSLLTKNIQAIEKFIEELKNITIPSPNVQVTTNQDIVIKSLNILGQEITSGLKELKATIEQKRNTEWLFSFTRNSNDVITSITAKTN